MLVSRKEWDYVQEETASLTATVLPRSNTVLKARFIITISMVAVIAMFVTVQSEAIVRAGYELVQMKGQLAMLEKENEVLRLDIAKLKSPQRIQNIAINELGMTLPQNVYRATESSATNRVNITVAKQDKTTIGHILNMLRTGKAEASPGQ